MEALLTLTAHFTVQWVWLGRQITATNPFTVHVFDLGMCRDDTLFKTLAVNPIPWAAHYNYNDSYAIANSDTVVILTNSPEDTKHVIRGKATGADARRARYILVQCNYVEEDAIEQLATFALRKQLTQVVVIRLADTAIYALLPKCQKRRVSKVSAVQWLNPNKLDLTNCSLKIVASNSPPIVIFNSENDNSLTGFYAPFYRYVKAALKFQGMLIDTPYSKLSTKLMAEEADMHFTPAYVTPNVAVEIPFMFSTKMIWCVPDLCDVGGTTKFLWCEFTGSTWLLLAASVGAVSLAARWFSPANSITCLDSLFENVSILASVSAKMRGGHARWSITGWLIATLVLSTGYQTVLHSMMAAPIFVRKIVDAHDLLQSQIPLVCMPAMCTQLKEITGENPVSAELADRIQEVNQSIATPFILSHQENLGVYTNEFACNSFFPKMTALSDEQGTPTYVGLFGVASSSWLAPALRQVVLEADASGLITFWRRSKIQHVGCTGPNAGKAASHQSQPITLALLWPAIFLWCCGLAISLIAFLVETWWFKCKTQQMKLKI